MADGSRTRPQSGFNFPERALTSALRAGEIVVDLFAGGGGASEALRQALGRDPDICINHDEWAIGMHAANHPFARHLCEDVWEADPRTLVAGRAVGWMHASPDCFPAGTMVLTFEGYRPIEEVDVGDLVLTHAGRWRPVTATMSAERELIRLTGHGHPGLTVSQEHPVFARKRRDVWSTSPRGYRAEYNPAEWVRAGNLERGWYWATPQAFPASDVPAVGGRSMEISPTLMWLVGRYLGDGWTRLDGTHAELVITCGKHEAASLAWLKDFWRPQSGRAGRNELSWQERQTGTAYQFTTSHQGLIVWLREHFGHGAAEKRIPGWALGMPSDLRKALLEGYCSADGHRTDAFIETQSVSKALAFGIKALAASLGHTVAVYTASNRGTVQGRRVNVRPVWRCRWRHAVDAAHQQTFRDDLHEWAPIRKTEHGVGCGVVYNLSVEQDESYVAEGIVVHNCTHFSQAKGGQPRSRATRSLSWVVLKWAGTVRPRIVSLENVKEILKWGPLVAKRDKATGRVLRLDGSVAAPGERVPIGEQYLIPDKRHEGRTWRAFVAALRSLGYTVEWRRVKACDHGAGTSRERLFMVARCDGEAIRWPEETHGPGRALPYVTAADCIDFSIPCPSIFTRKKPLADATLRRIARGVQRYVIDAAEPFIVPCIDGAPTAQQPLHDPANITGVATGSRNGSASERVTRGRRRCTSPVLTEFANASRGATWSADEPLRTQCAQVKGGHFALVSAILAGVGGRAGDSEPRPINEPGYTTTAKADCALVTAYLEQAAGGPNSNPSRPRDMREPISTIVGTGSQQQLVAASMVTLRNNCTGAGADEPLGTLSAGGEHHAVVECALSPEAEAGALRVAAFLVNYYGNGQPLDCREPLDTVTTRDRLALVTVQVRGVPYVIVDIGLRMLKPHELYRAQGFPADYIIDRTADGRAITGTRAVKMVGNSVSPPPLCAIARANLDPVRAEARAAA